MAKIDPRTGKHPGGRPKGRKDSKPRKAYSPKQAAYNFALKAFQERFPDRKSVSPMDFCRDVLQNPEDYPFAVQQWAAELMFPYSHEKKPIAIHQSGPPPVILDATKLHELPKDQLMTLLKSLEAFGVQRAASDDSSRK